MPVIDAHVHLYPPEVGRDPLAWAAVRGEKHWAALCTRRRKDGSAVQLFPPLDELLREMDEAGIEKSILLGWYWENPETCVDQNRFYTGCVRAHPDRLAACASVHPAAGAAALDEIRRARDDGLIGLGELSPHSQHVAIDDPSLRAILELAASLHWPINLHVTDPNSAVYFGRVSTPLPDFSRLARDFPNTTFVLAHWGGGLAFDPEMRRLTNVHFDSAASPLLYGGEAWTQAVHSVGPDRLLFGSDNPLRLYPKTDNGIGLTKFAREARANLSADDAGAVLQGNARRLFQI